jgi:hypothetical protein
MMTTGAAMSAKSLTTKAGIPTVTPTATIPSGKMNGASTGMERDMTAEILEHPSLTKKSLQELWLSDVTPQQAREIGICLNCGNTALCPCCDTHCDRCEVKIGEIKRDG